jgi:hypothetical protein
MNCKECQFEIDSVELNSTLSQKSRLHIESCGSCHTFFNERRALRGLIGSLGMVTVPSDFDLRLRSKLAREKGSYHQQGLRLWNLMPSKVSLAIAASLIVTITAGALVKNLYPTQVETNIAVVAKDPKKSSNVELTSVSQDTTPANAPTTVSLPSTNLPVSTRIADRRGLQTTHVKRVNKDSVNRGAGISVDVMAISESPQRIAMPHSSSNGTMNLPSNNRGLNHQHGQIFCNHDSSLFLFNSIKNESNSPTELPRLKGVLQFESTDSHFNEASTETLIFGSNDRLKFFSER